MHIQLVDTLQRISNNILLTLYVLDMKAKLVEEFQPPPLRWTGIGHHLIEHKMAMICLNYEMH